MATQADPKKETLSPREVFEREAAAEAAQKQLVAESAAGLSNKGPECGALGSLEEVDDSGEMKCVDCDLTVAAGSRLGGLGRK
jgi:hypothetical protein